MGHVRSAGSGKGSRLGAGARNVHVRRRELDRRRVGLSVAAHAIMSVDRAEWAMQKPRLLEWMAWRRYLIATRASSGETYNVIEESAWIRLVADLDGVDSSPCQDRSLVAGRWSAGLTY